MFQEFGFDQLSEILLLAARTAFIEVQEQHSNETFYAFSLYHEPLWGYIFPTCNTEEGLTRRAQEYQKDKYGLGYALKSIEQLRKELRWNPCDWIYHLAGSEYFSPVEQWLTIHDIPKMLDKIGIYDKKWNQIHAEMHNICRAVLRTLDAEKVFEATISRDRLVLNIMMGDQDNSWIKHARVLNPSEVFERWQQEI